MLRLSTQVIRIAALPTMHLCLCAVTYCSFGDDGWRWMVVMVLDLPLLLLMHLFKDPPDTVMSVTILGTIWWLCIGIALFSMLEWFSKRRKARRG